MLWRCAIIRLKRKDSLTSWHFPTVWSKISHVMVIVIMFHFALTRTDVIHSCDLYKYCPQIVHKLIKANCPLIVFITASQRFFYFSLRSWTRLQNGCIFCPFQAYNVHINSSYHCGIRYSDLYQFNEQVCNRSCRPLLLYF